MLSQLFVFVQFVSYFTLLILVFLPSLTADKNGYHVSLN